MTGKNVLGILYSDAYNDNISDLTALRTAGSVPFGGRYRFIDFPLSNMVNSGIIKVGVIAKNNYRSLMDHVGSGKSWDLSRKHSGLFILPPYNFGGGQYSGRLEALRNTMDFIQASKEEYVLLCDTNIICNMDFKKLIKFHEAKESDITICYKNGKYPQLANLMKFKPEADGRIKKMAVPPQAEDGEGTYGVNIIVMKKSLLERLVIQATAGDYDIFEKEVIMKNLDKLNVFGYEIENYCSVIDSMQTYYDTNMDLLDPAISADVFDRNNPVYTKVLDDMPAIYGIGSKAKNCVLADGCKIEGEVENSVLFRGVHVAKGAVVKNSVIMQSCYIGEDANLNCVIMDKNGVIRPRKSISGDSTYPIYIGKNITI